MANHESPPAGPHPAEPLVHLLRDVLSAEEALTFAYLFGSFAKGRSRSTSDVDVAIHFGSGDASSRFERGLELEAGLEAAVGRAVQVVVLDDAPLELRQNVLAHGQLLVDPEPATRRQFYVEQGRRYYDMEHARAIFTRYRARRIQEGPSVVEAATVRRLLESIEQRLRRLEERSGIELSEYLEDPDVRDIVARNLEIAIQSCIDLGLHILADSPEPLPETSRGVFVALAALDLIPASLSERLQRMAGFRNILAHGYTTIVPERVHDALSRLDDFRDYVRALRPYLTDQGVL